MTVILAVTGPRVGTAVDPGPYLGNRLLPHCQPYRDLTKYYVVAGDQAAGRVPDPVVRTELVYLRAQQAKRRASDLLGSGDPAAALNEIRQARQEIAEAPGPRVRPATPLNPTRGRC
jgi:hypothetical protein